MSLTAKERLDFIWVKIERAKKHLHDLEAACKAFWDVQPNIVRHKINPNTRECTYYVENISDVPLEIAAITGDTLNNVRSALDYLAYQLVDAAGAAHTSQHCFPIYDSAAKFKTESLSKTKGMRPDAIQAINAIRPYKGGTDELWRLHVLNNIDKHRLLVTVGVMNFSHGMTPSMKAKIIGSFGDPPPNLSGIQIASPSRNRSVKVGDELLTIPETEVEQPMPFCFHIAFAEPQIIEGYSVVETLKRMSDRVEKIISDFTPLLE